MRRGPADTALDDSPLSVVPVRSVALSGIFLLLLVVVLKLAAPLVVPVVLAVFFSLLLAPLVSSLSRLQVPRALGAILVIASVTTLIGSLGSYLYEPALDWVQRAPALATEIRQKLTPLREPVEQIGRVAEEVENITAVQTPAAAAEVTIAQPGIVDAIMAELPLLIGSTVIVLFLTFFFLASGESMMRKLARLGRNFAERRKLVLIALGIRQEITSYLVTVTIVNATLGIAVALSLHLLGVPNAILWGALAMVANYAPYVGAAIMFLLLAVVGLVTQDSLAAGLAVPASFLALTMLEGQLITPLILGRRLGLSAGGRVPGRAVLGLHLGHRRGACRRSDYRRRAHRGRTSRRRAAA